MPTPLRPGPRPRERGGLAGPRRPPIGCDPVAEFLTALGAEHGASPHTLAAYRADLRHFTAFLAGTGRALERARPDEVLAYIERLQREGLKPA
ncbi:MAG: site-specific integrase, partial [Candidatus Rokuibacteriota bacterium]